MNYVYVGIGGLIGTVARYAVSSLAVARFGSGFPVGTFFINVSGSFLLGLFVAVLAARGSADGWRLFLTVGFCGGYTTFSTYSLETLSLLQSGRPGLALLYFAGGPVLGVLGAYLGLSFGRLT
jgi:CrcB protein